VIIARGGDYKEIFLYSFTMYWVSGIV
jgi:hypothetical protein